MYDDHDRVSSVIADLRDQLGIDGPRCPATFARLRWSLTSDVLRCLALERLRLTRLENTRDLRERCDQDERTFREHIAHWPAAAMQTRWHEYASEFRAILRLVEARLRDGQEAGSATITPASAQSRQPVSPAARRT